MATSSPPRVGTYAPPGHLAPAPPPRRCPNCGEAAPDRYCAACGQEQRDRVHTSLAEIARDGLEDVLDWDSKIVRSFRLLLLRPGHLTAEYLAGRRVRHLRPLRMYFAASVLFFLALSATVTGDGSDDRGDAAPATATEGAAAADSAVAPPAVTLRGGAGESRAGRFLEERMARFAELDAAEQRRRVVDGFQANLPKALFALVPVFALLLAALYRSRRRYYAEHLVFALHLHAFAFLLLAAGQVVPDLPRVPDPWMLLLPWGLGYLAVALHRVYGGSPSGTAIRLALLVPLYSFALSLGVLGALLVSLVVA